MSLLYFFLTAIVLFFIFLAWSEFQVNNARKKGAYPQKGQATDDDVKRLALSGNQVLAIRAYREIHGASLKNSKIAVEKIIEDNKTA